MYRALDNLLLRFEEAWTAFRDPFHSHDQFKAGVQAGKEIGFAQVRQQFDTFDPYNIENQHFKMGFYYAKEQAKKVMTDDNGHNLVD
jgi:hypothetical protein